MAKKKRGKEERLILQRKFGKRWITQEGTFTRKDYKQTKKIFKSLIRIKPKVKKKKSMFGY